YSAAHGVVVERVYVVNVTIDCVRVEPALGQPQCMTATATGHIECAARLRQQMRVRDEPRGGSIHVIQNSECRIQNADTTRSRKHGVKRNARSPLRREPNTVCILHSAFCILNCA